MLRITFILCLITLHLSASYASTKVSEELKDKDRRQILLSVIKNEVKKSKAFEYYLLIEEPLSNKLKLELSKRFILLKSDEAYNNLISEERYKVKKFSYQKGQVIVETIRNEGDHLSSSSKMIFRKARGRWIGRDKGGSITISCTSPTIYSFPTFQFDISDPAKRIEPSFLIDLSIDAPPPKRHQR